MLLRWIAALRIALLWLVVAALLRVLVRRLEISHVLLLWVLLSLLWPLLWLLYHLALPLRQMFHVPCSKRVIPLAFKFTCLNVK